MTFPSSRLCFRCPTALAAVLALAAAGCGSRTEVRDLVVVSPQARAGAATQPEKATRPQPRAGSLQSDLPSPAEAAGTLGALSKMYLEVAQATQIVFNIFFCR